MEVDLLLSAFSLQASEKVLKISFYCCQTGMEEKARIFYARAARRRSWTFAWIIDRERVDELSAVAVVTHKTAVFCLHCSVRMSVASHDHCTNDL